MKYELIPGELKLLPNWVCWRAIPDSNSHSGIRKIPINPLTGGQAMSNNPQTWSDFDTALKVSANYDGIGFMFGGSGYFGVDIDDCRSDIDGYLLGEADNIISEFIHGLQTYAEQSQSGNGIHLIARGTLPKGGRRKGKVEMYDSGRFFIMTGNCIGDYPYIAECTEQIIPLHAKYIGVSGNTTVSNNHPTVSVSMTEREIIDKIMQSSSGSKFAALYSGNFSDYPSQSEADMAFCSILAFWCGGNTELMDNIYRSSGLMRDKWDRRQSGSTYGAITLNRAAQSCQNFYQPQHAMDDYHITIQHSSTAPINVGMKNTSVPFLPMHTLDDTGNAERMNDGYGKHLRYNYTDKRWMYYKDGKWHYDDRGMVYVAADGVLERMKQELHTWAEHENGKYLQDYQKHMKRTRSNAAKRAMVKEFEHIVSISPDDLDTNKTLVNSRSGVLDLATGRISPHNS